MKDENGSQTDANKKPYKFDYDMKGVVSCADPAKGAINFDQIGSVWTDKGERDNVYANLSKTPIKVKTTTSLSKTVHRVRTLMMNM